MMYLEIELSVGRLCMANVDVKAALRERSPSAFPLASQVSIQASPPFLQFKESLEA